MSAPPQPLSPAPQKKPDYATSSNSDKITGHGRQQRKRSKKGREQRPATDQSDDASGSSAAASVGHTTSLMKACMHNLEHDVRSLILKKVLKNI